MLSLILLINIIFLIIGIYLCTHDKDDVGAPLTAINAFVGFCLLVSVVIGITIVATSKRIETKIEICTEENTLMEQSIKDSVETYFIQQNKDHENISNLDASTLLIAYPEFKGNELIESQINQIILNREEIKKYRNQLTDISVWKFLIYFGS